MLAACATDDKLNLISDHFGDAKYYNIYDVNENDYSLKETIVNKTTSDLHSDPKKAKQILDLLHTKGVHLLINKAFGANIKVVNKFVLPVVIRVDLIEDVIKLVQNSFSIIENVLETKKDCYLIIKQDEGVKVIETI
jgi:predicted Fe-Mo cluster-binding NifX family protein